MVLFFLYAALRCLLILWLPLSLAADRDSADRRLAAMKALRACDGIYQVNLVCLFAEAAVSSVKHARMLCCVSVYMLVVALSGACLSSVFGFVLQQRAFLSSWSRRSRMVSLLLLLVLCLPLPLSLAQVFDRETACANFELPPDRCGVVRLGFVCSCRFPPVPCIRARARWGL